MFLRYKDRRKDGKQHRYWSVVENTRVTGGRVVQRHVLYLGEINDSQELAWRRSIEVLADGETRPRTLSLFPEDRCEGLCRELELDEFWGQRLGVSRKSLPSRRPPAAEVLLPRHHCPTDARHLVGERTGSDL